MQNVTECGNCFFPAEVIIDELLNKDVAHVYVAECITMRADDVKDMFAQKVVTLVLSTLVHGLN